MSWIFGGISSLGFLVFSLCPVVYITRMWTGARTRAPIVLVVIYFQLLVFLALFFTLNWVVVPRFASLFEMLSLRLGFLTRLVISQSTFLRSIPGAALSLVSVLALLRGTGRFLQSRWRDDSYPSGWIDQIGLMSWGVHALVMGFIVLGLYLPIHDLGKRPEPGPGDRITRARDPDPVASTMWRPFVAEISRAITGGAGEME